MVAVMARELKHDPERQPEIEALYPAAVDGAICRQPDPGGSGTTCSRVPGHTGVHVAYLYHRQAGGAARYWVRGNGE